MNNKLLHRFSLATAFMTFILIFVGGLVTSTSSGLSVPDWPTTYGENMFTFPIDKWVGGIKFEHGHRLVASFVGLLTVILAVWIVLKEDRRWVKWLGLYALAAVILQGILGGVTVLFLLPTIVSIAHGMLAQTFFCVVSGIALVTSPWWENESTNIQNTNSRSMQTLSIIATSALFLQLIFGALMRHTYSGLAIPDFPLAYGQLFPSLSKEAMTAYNQELINAGIKWVGDKPVASYQIVIHLIHRVWAYAAAGIVLTLGYRLWKTSALPKQFKTIGRYLSLFILVQFSLGFVTVLSRKEYITTSLHVVVGALVLVTCFLTTIMIARVRWISKNSQKP